ncbi:peptidoglycan recognition protein 1-like [Macrosteles quadrilineatus]|uniref:peptidoglycan recognition protein 1-like n=1 Tax=Macrosteles quadrilineatus TaxID=74068 RepID=UPI0023E09581|nr:peptidoglycan recognition protein 1-like [Macrosteles quadrilineatus]
MQFLTSVQVVLIQNLFWWTVMCSSLAVLLRFFVITSVSSFPPKTSTQGKTEKPTKKNVAVWVVIHSGGCSGGDTARRGCNFLVSGGGEVSDGRGWGVTGSTNNNSVDIYLIGDYQDESPSDNQVSAVSELITSGVSEGFISADYKLVGHRQVQSAPTTCPDTRLYSMLQKWPRYAAHVE